MHQSAPDLSFFTSSEGRLAGGEAGRGAWGRGCREEGSLASFLNKRHNRTDQGMATRESRDGAACSPSFRQNLFNEDTPEEACIMHSRVQWLALSPFIKLQEQMSVRVSESEVLWHAASAGTFQSVTHFSSGSVRVLTCPFSGPKRAVWSGGGAEDAEEVEERGSGWDTECCCPTLLSWNK